MLCFFFGKVSVGESWVSLVCCCSIQWIFTENLPSGCLAFWSAAGLAVALTRATGSPSLLPR